MPGTQLHSPVGLGRATAVMLGLVIAADLFDIWVGVLQIDVVGDVLNGINDPAALRRGERADHLHDLSGVVQILTLLATAVVYLNWFHRVRVNAEIFDPSGHAKSRGWAIGSWFCPIVNLWFPRRITLDIWDSSAPRATRPGHGLVNSWWALWIVSLFVDQVAARQYDTARGVIGWRHATRHVMFSDALDIAAAVLAVLVVLKVTRMQYQKGLEGPVAVPALG